MLFFIWIFLFVIALVVYEQLVLIGRRRRAREAGGRFILSRQAAPLWPLIGMAGQVELMKVKEWINGRVRHFKWQAFGAGFPLISRFMLVITTPSDVEVVLRDPFSFPKGKRLREMLFEFLGNGIFNADDENWKRQRKISSHMFSARRLRDFSSRAFTADSEELVEVLLGFGPDEEIDIQALFTALTLQSFVWIAFGERPRELQATKEGSGNKTEFSQSFDSAVLNLGLRIVQPLWKIKRIFGIGTERELAKSLAKVDPFIKKLISDRLSQTSPVAAGNGDLLSLYLDRDEPEINNIPFLEDVCRNFLLAGRDTTSAALTTAVRFLAMHPQQRDLVEQEADRLLAESGGKIDFELAKRASYLEAFLLESLRLVPPVSEDFKEVRYPMVLPGSGVYVEAGDRISYSIWAVNTNPKVWGDDSLTFDPSRWHGATKRGPPATCSAQELAFSYPTFNAGPRLCLGRQLALVEAKICLLTFFKNRLRFSLSKPIDDLDWSIYTPSAVVFLTDGLKGTLTTR